MNNSYNSKQNTPITLDEQKAKKKVCQLYLFLYYI